MQEVDERVERQEIVRRAKGLKLDTNPKSNAIYCPERSTERDSLNLLYLKPEQYALLHDSRNTKVKIIGPGGSGKTVVMILKILMLAKSSTKYDILVLAPNPHHLRCEALLKKKGVQNVFIETEFPLKPAIRINPLQPVVRIIRLDEERMETGFIDEGYTYNEHLFIDDAQTIVTV